MINYRFNPLTSYIILGVLCGAAGIVAWSTWQAFEEIGDIEASIQLTVPLQ